MPEGIQLGFLGDLGALVRRVDASLEVDFPVLGFFLGV
jgi:hypothetical protein